MRGRFACLAACTALLAISGCQHRSNDRLQITLQRFFGACDAEYGNSTNVAAAEGECGIITTLINEFNAQNPDLEVRVNVVYWPGYDQLSAELAAGDPPDLVTMHQSVISDYSQRHLIIPLEEGLRSVGIDAGGFTRVAREGVVRDGHIYALPFDNWAPLWHINMNLFRAAGLVSDGKPLLPHSPAELLQQARQFKRATGKPYLIQSMVNEPSAYARNLFTFLMQQNSDFFADPRHIKLQTPEARRVLELFKQIYDEGLTTKNQDYTAATSGFLNGQGGVYLVGTWMIGTYEQASKQTGSPLAGGYAVAPYPQLYPGRDATYADGHSWVVPKARRSRDKMHAIFRLLQFLRDNDYQWSRTGHLPAYKDVIDSQRWRSLPHRAEIAKLVEIAEPLPSGVQRQFLIQQIISEEMESAITGQKSINTALADAERRVNDVLFNLL
ncbi:MAG TPA: extracellular solute-binding protein [Steroidobacteraceae bacterium]|jgi:multiple sugar transport system substrate-binding protein|nr:extracellular solute-binding protein [Steroidobacteraceae bacterium]